MTTNLKSYKTESIVPKNDGHWHELRARDITSTEVAALFDINPYMTRFELWHRKKNQLIVQIEQNNRMKWGTRLEDAIARGIGEDQGWKIRRVNRYMRIPELRIGSSFDFEVTGLDTLLEIKNVDGLAFRDGWIADGDNVEAPPHIELQVQHQLAVSQKKSNTIGALVGGNNIVLLARPANVDVIAAIHRETKIFWDSIDANEPPAPDFSRDADFIASLYSTAAAGKILDASKDSAFRELATRYSEAQKTESTAKDAKEALKAEMLTMIGDAEKVMGGSFSISAGVVAGGPVSYERKPYRNFRLNWKKPKETA
jgi:putative phage-type endonuclease